MHPRGLRSPPASSSEADSDWSGRRKPTRGGGGGGGAGGGRKRQRRKVPLYSGDGSDDGGRDLVAFTDEARASLRLVGRGNVNYAEEGESDLDSLDSGAKRRAAEQSAAEDLDSLVIERVVDYRPVSTALSAPAVAPPAALDGAFESALPPPSDGAAATASGSRAPGFDASGPSGAAATGSGKDGGSGHTVPPSGDDGGPSAGAVAGTDAPDEPLASTGRAAGIPLKDFEAESAEFQIKWRRRSYRQSSWNTLEELRSFSGYKRVTNYVKKMEELRAVSIATETSSEEREELALHLEENRGVIGEYSKIERIVAERAASSGTANALDAGTLVADDGEPSEFLVKWKNLSYAESTWETAADLQSPEDLAAIDDFKEREQTSLALSSASRCNPFSSKSRRPFRKMPVQPGWLEGGVEGRRLRDYQLEGLNWLAYSWVNRRNVILADEMGLGKTLQTISFLGWLKNEKSVYGPFLVVVPLSTMAAWQREFARWLPDMNVVTYVGDAASRELIRRYEFAPSPRARKTAGVDVRFHVLLSTPELVMMDQAHLSQLRYAVVAVDEAHRLKNEESSLHRILADFRSANRLLITGTPLQNSIRELWALLHFLTPEEFADAAEFEEQFSFSALREPETVAALHMALRPYVLRRQKGDVEKSLPRKTYAVLRVGMASTQQQYYRWILTRNFSKLNAAAKSGGRSIGSATSLLNIVMELKKCCNHPYLFDGVEDSNATDAMTALIRASGKMILLDKLLLRLRDAGHRVLIFSQMVRMLDILQDYCRMRGFACQRLDGSMPNDLRQRAVDHYNAPGSNDFAFLLSTRAGGLGINLATADTVIIFDSDWNPQNDLQAESRAHRIGQTRDVKVFRLLSRDTVEEDILERAKRKRVLEHLVIHGVERGEGEASAAVPKPAAFRKEELSAILRFGAEQLFKSGAVDGVAAPPGSAGASDGAAAGPALPGPAAAGGEKPLEMDDIDEVLQRAPAEDDAADGAGGGTMGDSLLNAFKWADFATTEEPDEEAAAAEAKAKKAKDKARIAAESAASRLTALESSQKAAKLDMEQREAADRELLGKEGDNEFWGRVIPRDLQEDLVASQLYLAPRSRKRVKHYAKDHGSDEEEGSDSDGEVADDGDVGDPKRRGGSGGVGGKAAAARGRGKGRKAGTKGSGVGSGAKPPRGGKGGKRGAAGRSRGDVSDQGDEELTQERRLVPDLTAKEVRALVKSLRKFGVASRAEAVVADAGLVDRVSVDDARRLLESVLARAHRAVDAHAQMDSLADTDELGVANGGSHSVKSAKAHQAAAPGTKRARVASGATPTIVVGREVMNASEMVTREAELAALATAVGGYPSETQFRLRAAAKPPAYGVKWTTINDAMLLVGILRHGLGNWKLIATDKDLGLDTKLSTPGSPVVGAPDTPKVVRRALTLLRSVSASVAASSRAAARVAAGKSKAAAAARK
eukprot:contig_27538_g6773